MKSRNCSTSYNLLAKSINQVISYLLSNCFPFLTKFWMLQVRKSRFSGISAIFFQCCFMSRTEVLITVSNFFVFFFQESFPGRGLCFSMWGGGGGGVFFKWGRGIIQRKSAPSIRMLPCLLGFFFFVEILFSSKNAKNGLQIGVP